ncbi:uncharacterized protein LY79DRAFT_696700 [Colletotrichum navitas]|uniref:Uncharacterized protein n=1 Tax=Colletotrichum navitas TaxID=681940 RepID=A0AAD8PQE4_9PEZI|nr:uncharacterized protein LY79DRAFT_696700 [Colletotrichum navitas]KAK1573860.1 hypothetical protein LY79DRAFT_696700 [Colletotrichum navitas]
MIPSGLRLSKYSIYILWKYSTPRPMAASTRSKSSLCSLLSAKLTTQLFADVDKLQNLDGEWPSHIFNAEEFSNKEDLIMEQRVQFGNYISEEVITEIPDDWLGDELEFFGISPPDDEFNKRKFCLNESCNKEFCTPESCETKINEADATSCHFGKCVIGYAIKRAHLGVKDNYKDTIGMIADVPKTKTRSSEPTLQQVYDNTNKPIDHLQGKRNKGSAKRLLQFFQTNPKTALICYPTSSEAREIGPFFGRNARYQKYFFDSAVSASNKWVTELHLSFWKLDPTDTSDPPFSLAGFKANMWPQRLLSYKYQEIFVLVRALLGPNPKTELWPRKVQLTNHQPRRLKSRNST